MYICIYVYIYIYVVNPAFTCSMPSRLPGLPLYACPSHIIRSKAGGTLVGSFEP